MKSGFGCMEKYVMALDAGTTSNRCILFDRSGNIAGMAQKEFTQIFPQPGWVEHDADEIFSVQLEVARQAMQNAGVTASQIAAIGITNQRLFGIRTPADRFVMPSCGNVGALPICVIGWRQRGTGRSFGKRQVL